MIPLSELKTIDLTVRLFTEPALALDRDRLTEFLRGNAERKEDVLASLGVTKEDLGSAEKFARLLEGLGVEPPTKISKRTGKLAYAFAKTDNGMKELLNDSDERVSLLVGARLGVKSNIMETRGQRMLDMDSRGPMAVYLKYYGAHTGRWSGGDKMNWQNFKRNSALRESILAPEGYVLCVADLAQIECRVLNWLAGQEDVLDAFKTGRDLYSEGATRFYGRQISKTDKVERHLGKTLELGCGYGMGAEKFKLTCRQGALGGPSIELSDDQARFAVGSYRSSHRQVVELWYVANTMLDNLSMCRTCDWGPMQVTGRRIYYPGGSWSDYTHLRHDGENYYTTGRMGDVKMYGAKLVENVVQALSRVILSKMMLEIAKRYKVVTTTHDEVVYLAKEEEADEALQYGIAIMKTAPEWAPGLPLDVEGGYARNYSK